MKARFFPVAITALLTLSLFTSCEKIKGKGDVITETRSTSAYHSISLAMSATVYYTPDTIYSLQIRGQENILNNILTEVEGNQMVIHIKNGVILKDHEPVQVYIKAPALTGLTVSGSGDIFTENEWNTTSVSLNISGSGNINIATVNAGQLTANISGSGSITASSGLVKREDLKISGSGTINLRGVNAETVYTTTSGSGDTYLTASSLLDATISGSGNVWYIGTPAINVHISGSGNLKRL
ncbi:MAG: DUF2807 domain-containing protein [Bacteroidetes bacterium]|nr:DUF2807 domain-containing protein [Bacteroidota bacterium]